MSKGTDCIPLLDSLIPGEILLCKCAPCTRRREVSDGGWVGRRQCRWRERGISDGGWNLLEAVLGTSWGIGSVSHRSPEGTGITSSSAATTAKEMMEATCLLFASQPLRVSPGHLVGGLHCCAFNPTSSLQKAAMCSGSGVWRALQLAKHPGDTEGRSVAVSADE